MAVLLKGGADAQRMIDGDGWSLERFAAHLARMTALHGEAKPLVVLTQTNPIALAVVQTRRLLEEAVPELERAAWVIYHDPEVDPFFKGAAEVTGSLDVDWSSGPIWLTSNDYRFLVLGPYEKQLHLAAGRMAALELVELPISGVRLVGSQRPASESGPMRAVSLLK